MYRCIHLSFALDVHLIHHVNDLFHYPGNNCSVYGV